MTRDGVEISRLTFPSQERLQLRPRLLHPSPNARQLCSMISVRVSEGLAFSMRVVEEQLVAMDNHADLCTYFEGSSAEPPLHGAEVQRRRSPLYPYGVDQG